MKKSELKKALKPIVKECVREMLVEEGFLSGIVSEVVKGLSAAPLVESQQRPMPSEPQLQRSNENREKLLQAIGRDAYNGADLFEGTEAFNSYESRTPKQGEVDLGDPRDAGVDISSLMGQSSQIWKAMK